MSKAILAIDPGKSGGIAFLSESGKVWATGMPETEGDIVKLFEGIKTSTEGEIHGYLEKVGGFIAGKKLPGSAMFNFGANYGFLRGALLALKIPVEFITPQHWQSALSMGRKNKEMTKTQWKNVLKQEAQYRYPNLNVTLDTADALLILSYGKMDQRMERLV